jgi:hypothetical protein
MTNPNVLGILAKGRAAFTTHVWRDFLIRSIGLEPNALVERGKMVVLLLIAPFVERNFNLLELGPRGTGKSHHESTKAGEQNVYAHAKGLVGDRAPRDHEFPIQLAGDGQRLQRRRPRLAVDGGPGRRPARSQHARQHRRYGLPQSGRLGLNDPHCRRHC